MIDSGEPVEGDSTQILRQEASIYARYLSGGPAPPEIIERHVDACRKLLLDRPAREEQGLLAFARRHPWSLPALDAACSVIRPEAMLRKRLFVMLALLETSPAHAPLFIATPRRRLAAAGRLVLHGVSASLKVVLGLALYPVARGAR